MTDPGSETDNELLPLFHDYEFEEPQTCWRKTKCGIETNEAVNELIHKDDTISQQNAPLQACDMLAYWREIDRKRETNELVNVLIDENEKISQEILRVQKSEESKLFEFLKQSKKRNEEDEKNNEKLISENAIVYCQLTEAMKRKKELAETNALLKADKKKLVKETEMADDKMHSRIEKLCAQQCELERKLEIVSVSTANIARENKNSSHEQLEMLKGENEQLAKTLLERSMGPDGLIANIAEILAENEKMIAEIN